MIKNFISSMIHAQQNSSEADKQGSQEASQVIEEAKNAIQEWDQII